MFKNKLSTSLFAGGMAILGMVAGTALIASAQTGTSSTPTVTNSSATTAKVVDTPENANDPADTDIGSKHDVNDADGSSASEAAEGTDSDAADR